MRVLRAFLAAALLGLAPVAAPAQGTAAQPPLLQGGLLTIDPDRLFTQSLFGKRVLADAQSQTEALAAENRQIEAQLTAEEKDLTAKRPKMSPQDFRVEADAFDAKVQDIRKQQDAKERALQDIVTKGREAFFNAARPELGRLMLSRGAVAILDRRSLFLSVAVIDITDAAISAIDNAIGDGAQLDAGQSNGSGSSDTTTQGGSTQSAPVQPSPALNPAPDPATVPATSDPAPATGN
ncbi:MAG: OmpH family outer membrane protein [Limimaricola sp.]|uniref:OmpH family outer membrane protein n=1 Tax=Limimaricola sp. TaxID=2211665 RepID=UPI001D1D2C64|nr:OmpH family outer membrane protein [Limimaricola sp.]MBI1418015.1 OmpH family outer membrane protein [Limimaricola sp.]